MAKNDLGIYGIVAIAVGVIVIKTGGSFYGGLGAGLAGVFMLYKFIKSRQ